MAERTGVRGQATVHTACPLDCPDSCSLAVTVDRGQVVVIDGSHGLSVTNGFICAKVRHFHERMYGDSRLRYPVVRTGPKGRGTLARVSWDEALGLIAERIREIRAKWGGEAILPFSYGGSNGLLTQDTTDADLFHGLGASRLARTVCAAPTGAANQALYGKMPSVTYSDYPHARLIVLWGVNPSTSGIHLVPFVRDAQRRGAVVVVIDPRRRGLARQADLHLPVRPGTDVAVALAIHRYLFEAERADWSFLEAHTTGAERLRERAAPWTFERAASEADVDPQALAWLARTYADTSPALIRCGWGLERNRNGGNAALAILALPAVAGKFGIRGGGYSMSNSASWPIAPAARRRTDEPATRVVNMNHLGRALLDYDAPPIKLLFVYNCNPAATMPDQNRVTAGLQRNDLFTVVFDQVHTDTARFADVVLPATTFLEHYDFVRAYGPISLQLARPVVDAVGEARPNVEVFSELGARLELDGFGKPESEGEALMRIASALPPDVGGPLIGNGRARPPDGEAPVQFADVFPRTPDGRVHLFPEMPEGAEALYVYRPDPATERYPLALISPASDRTISSTLGELRKQPARLSLHPDEAARRGIEDGQTVRVFNELGEVHCLAAVDESIRPGTVSLPKGLWCDHTLNGSTANALAPDALTDLGGGACFNDARVDVARVLSAELGDASLALSVGSP